MLPLSSLEKKPVACFFGDSIQKLMLPFSTIPLGEKPQVYITKQGLGRMKHYNLQRQDPNSLLNIALRRLKGERNSVYALEMIANGFGAQPLDSLGSAVIGYAGGITRYGHGFTYPREKRHPIATHLGLLIVNKNGVPTIVDPRPTGVIHYTKGTGKAVDPNERRSPDPLEFAIKQIFAIGGFDINAIRVGKASELDETMLSRILAQKGVSTYGYLQTAFSQFLPPVIRYCGRVTVPTSLGGYSGLTCVKALKAMPEIYTKLPMSALPSEATGILVGGNNERVTPIIAMPDPDPLFNPVAIKSILLTMQLMDWARGGLDVFANCLTQIRV